MKREHGIIQNALFWLENLGRLTEVTDIIPGVIDVSHSSERGVVYKYETQTGCKLLLKSNGSIQEVFVVTKNPASIQEWVKQEFPPASSSSVSQVISRSKLQSISRTESSNVPLKSKRGSKKTSARSLQRSRKRSFGKVSKPSFGDEAPPNIAEHLDLATLKALNHLKQSLKNVKIQDTQAEFENSLRK